MASNSLGLDFSAEERAEEPKAETADGLAETTPEKKKPYVNSERVKTGGQREKPSEEELAERIRKIREQNEAIKQRRIDVKADEDAFKETQKHDLIKLAKNRKVQQDVDRSREQNAKRKMDKVQSREWDSGKPAPGDRDDWKNRKPVQAAPTQSIRISGATPASPSGPSGEESVTTAATLESPRGPKPKREPKPKTDSKANAESKAKTPESKAKSPPKSKPEHKAKSDKPKVEPSASKPIEGTKDPKLTLETTS